MVLNPVVLQSLERSEQVEKTLDYGQAEELPYEQEREDSGSFYTNITRTSSLVETQKQFLPHHMRVTTGESSVKIGIDQEVQAAYSHR